MRLKQYRNVFSAASLNNVDGKPPRTTPSKKWIYILTLNFATVYIICQCLVRVLVAELAQAT